MMPMKILLSGCSGAMGTELSDYADSLDDVEIVAGICKGTSKKRKRSYPVYESFSQVKEQADVIIDFSHVTLLSDLISYAKKTKIPVLFATTGYCKEDEEAIFKISRDIAVFRASNLSAGVNKLMKIIEHAVKLLGGEYDIEIIESHSSHKADAPSGTAKIIQKCIENNLVYNPNYIYGRYGIGNRNKYDIGVHSIRGGNMAGSHSVIFSGNGDIIKIEHIAVSKKIFAQTAIKAAFMIKDKENGYFVMEDLIY